MLSRRLQTLHDWWDDIITSRAQMTREGLIRFRDELQAAAHDARLLEEFGASLPASEADTGIAREFMRVAEALESAPNVILFRRRHPCPSTDGRGGAA